MWLSAGDRGEPCAPGRSSTRAPLILTLLGPGGADAHEIEPVRRSPLEGLQPGGELPAQRGHRADAGTLPPSVVISSWRASSVKTTSTVRARPFGTGSRTGCTTEL